MTALANWLLVLGEELDCGLNVLLFWFLAPAARRDETISEHAAEAQRAGRRWGCVLCWWLSRAVERDHCAKTLARQAITRIGALKAGMQLLLVALLLGAPIYWAIWGLVW